MVTHSPSLIQFILLLIEAIHEFVEDDINSIDGILKALVAIRGVKDLNAAVVGGYTTGGRRIDDENEEDHPCDDTESQEDLSDDSHDHYSLSYIRRVHLSKCPLASAVFAQPANFKFVIRDGYRALEVGHTCAREVKEKDDELYLSNANYGVDLPPSFLYHSDRFGKQRGNRTITSPSKYIKRNGFIANEFWRQVTGRAHVGTTFERIHAVFQLIELVYRHRKQYVGDIQHLSKALKHLEQQLKASQARADTPKDEIPAQVEDQQSQNSDNSTSTTSHAPMQFGPIKTPASIQQQLAVLKVAAETSSHGVGKRVLVEDEEERNDSKGPRSS